MTLQGNYIISGLRRDRWKGHRLECELDNSTEAKVKTRCEVGLRAGHTVEGSRALDETSDGVLPDLNNHYIFHQAKQPATLQDSS